MPTTLELQSTLTDRYQTTVPDAVRRALGLTKRDRIRYLVRGDGSVVMQRAEEGEDRPPERKQEVRRTAHFYADHL